MRRVRLDSAMILSAALLAGCQQNAGPAATGEKEPILNVAHPVERKLSEFVDYTGRTNAKDSVTIQPRVTGYITKLPFKEGADVKKGELLFEIDPRPYEAQLEAAKAAVAQNVAALKYAQATNLRYKELEKKNKGAVSERELDQYQALEDQAIANLNLAKANLVSAELNLEWTKVRSPIDGVISRYYMTMGNLVNQDVTQLTTVVSMDPLYVYFDVDEPTLLKIKEALNDGKITPPAEGGDMKVLMGLPGDAAPRYEGTINFIDNQVNPGTGSISVRGVFKNPRPKGGTYLFSPGMFVRVRLPIGDPQNELLVIDRAITSDQGIKYVYTIDKDNEIKARQVTLGSLQDDGLRVITHGIKADDWVLVGGLQQVRPRMKIEPVYVTMPSLAAPAEVQPSKTTGNAKKK